MMQPATPQDHGYGDPLEANGRQIQKNAVGRNEFWAVQQGANAQTAAPRHDDGQNRENRNVIPVHVREVHYAAIRTKVEKIKARVDTPRGALYRAERTKNEDSSYRRRRARTCARVEIAAE